MTCIKSCKTRLVHDRTIQDSHSCSCFTVLNTAGFTHPTFLHWCKHDCSYSLTGNRGLINGEEPKTQDSPQNKVILYIPQRIEAVKKKKILQRITDAMCEPGSCVICFFFIKDMKGLTKNNKTCIAMVIS
ncbi:hypothetical protein GDO81_000102 [Engystomops pustulosus]|uniref:Uncharacterized protein n=1 Tax=Engystomops pustulosus TaxID=76066 RepID=A0AAV7D1F4_ENGPU|nr:hypothetical protein GDO81_000102 [Engystomops pustulosus]